MERATKFEDLVMWQKSHALTLRTYRLTKAFPRDETYGLAAQMRRAAVSVSANIAEGFSKRSRLDKARFMNIAQASLEELRYYYILSKNLKYLAAEEGWDDGDEVGRILGAYTRALLAPSS